MAWWDDAYAAAVAVVDATAEVVETVANVAADTIADAVESAGNAAQDGLNAAGNFFGGWVGGAFAWLGGVVAGITNLAGAVVKAAFGIQWSIIGGLIRIIGGALLLNWGLISKGLIDIVSGVAGAVISLFGTFWALVQRIIFLQNNDRPLTKEERERLIIVFQNSLALYNIRLIEGWSGLYGTTTNGAFTLNNTIYLNATDLTVFPETLVHECVHVWQYQNLGTRYLMDALGAMAIYGRTGAAGDAYDWTAELARGTSRWEDFNKEAQAELISEIWTDGVLRRGGAPAGPFRHPLLELNGNPILDTNGAEVINNHGGGFFELQDCEGAFGKGFCTAQFIALSDNINHPPRDGVDHTPLAHAAIDSLRHGWNFRFSRNF